MRPYGFLVGRNAGLHAAPLPGGRTMHASKPRRRLDDALVDIFGRAVASNKLDSADDLLTLLEKWQGRRKIRYGREKRIGDAELKAMRADLNRLTALRTS